MVIQRTIEHLREQPAEHRRYVAGAVAIGAMVILFLGWITYFYSTVQDSSEHLQNVGAAFEEATQQVTTAYDETQDIWREAQVGAVGATNVTGSNTVGPQTSDIQVFQLPE
jgi:hypothetical protein